MAQSTERKAQPELLVLSDSKNGERRAIPFPPKLATIIQRGRLPLTINRSTLQADRRDARKVVGLEHVTFSRKTHTHTV